MLTAFSQGLVSWWCLANFQFWHPSLQGLSWCLVPLILRLWILIPSPSFPFWVTPSRPWLRLVISTHPRSLYPSFWFSPAFFRAGPASAGWVLSNSRTPPTALSHSATLSEVSQTFPFCSCTSSAGAHTPWPSWSCPSRIIWKERRFSAPAWTATGSVDWTQLFVLSLAGHGHPCAAPSQTASCCNNLSSWISWSRFRTRLNDREWYRYFLG